MIFKKKYLLNTIIAGITCLSITIACFAQTNTSAMENTNGTTITLGGKEIHTMGKLPAVGTNAQDFTLTAVDLSEKTLADYKGKYIIMNIFPSVNTGVCSKSVRTFNQDASNLNNTVILCISKD